MKLLGLDGREYIYNFKKICKEAPNPSSLHLSARKLLHSKLSMCSIYEEVQLLGSRLIVDFFIPDMQIIVEVHGEQHYKYIKYFHKSEADFNKSKNRDNLKKDWAEINGFSFIELPFDKIDEWSNTIESYL